MTDFLNLVRFTLVWLVMVVGAEYAKVIAANINKYQFK